MGVDVLLITEFMGFGEWDYRIGHQNLVGAEVWRMGWWPGEHCMSWGCNRQSQRWRIEYQEGPTTEIGLGSFSDKHVMMSKA